MKILKRYRSLGVTPNLKQTFARPTRVLSLPLDSTANATCLTFKRADFASVKKKGRPIRFFLPSVL
jgi:hypothetical protein